MSKRAVVITGGKGSRLTPFTHSMPKALLPIGDYPVLEIIVRQLKYFGFTDITLSVFHFGEIIEAYFDNGRRWDVNINYSVEEFPLGTAGPLKLIANLPDNFLVINCDILSSLNFRTMFSDHMVNNNLFTVAAYKKSYKIPYGVLQSDNANRLIKLEEKPDTLQINAGIYVATKVVLDHIPKNQPFGMHNLMNALLDNSLPVSIYPFEGYWQDIGSEDEYTRAMTDFRLKEYAYMTRHY